MAKLSSIHSRVIRLTAINLDIVISVEIVYTFFYTPAPQG